MTNIVIIRMIILGCKNYAGISNSSYAHAVVICGYSRFSQTGATIYYSYRLMDPNVTSGYVIVPALGTGTNFTYGIYTQWHRSDY